MMREHGADGESVADPVRTRGGVDAENLSHGLVSFSNPNGFLLDIVVRAFGTRRQLHGGTSAGKGRVETIVDFLPTSASGQEQP